MAFGLVALGLVAYWLWFDHALHTQDRYYVRTAIFFATPVLVGLAVLRALRAALYRRGLLRTDPLGS